MFPKIPDILLNYLKNKMFWKTGALQETMRTFLDTVSITVGLFFNLQLDTS